jgi:hypothetical protein
MLGEGIEFIKMGEVKLFSRRKKVQMGRGPKITANLRSKWVKTPEVWLYMCYSL